MNLIKNNKNIILVVVLFSLSHHATASDCAHRLNDYGQGAAASLVVQDNRALLVWVPYGHSPGWDFPGGHRKGNEFACETAEREACEETSFAIRALSKISGNVFRAELSGGQGCTAPVDEGFLETRWVSYDEVDHLQLRGGTWGDKRGILKQHLSSGTGPDACGCTGGQGWSSTFGECRWGSHTDANEAQQCQANNNPGNSSWHPSCQSYMIDALQNFPPNASEVEGMRWNTEPVSWRACVEQYQLGGNHHGSEPDACGCSGGQGWSSTYGECRWGSQTDANEVQQCLANTHPGNDTWHPSCENYMITALQNYPPNAPEVEGMRWNTEPVSWRACVEQYQQGNSNSGGDANVICVFDYDLTLSSHYCPSTVGRPEFHCSNVGPTYGWTEQCLASAAREAVQRCLAEGAKLALASHSPYDQAKIDALQFTGWPGDGYILMQPGRNKAEMIHDIRMHFNMHNAHVLFWDDTPSNINAVSDSHNVFATQVQRGDPQGSNCGIQSHHIGEGWGRIGR